MEGVGDGGGSIEHTIASPSTTLAELFKAPPSRLPSHDLLSSEALEDSPRPEFPLDQLIQDPSSAHAGNLSEWPSQQRDMSPLPANASGERLWQDFSSSQRLSFEGADHLLIDSLPKDSSVEVHNASHEASPMHPQTEILPSEALADGLLQNMSPEEGSHESSASDEVSQAEQSPPSTSADQSLQENSLEHLPMNMEDSQCISGEKEVADDVKREMLKERCKGVAILSCKSEATGGLCYVYLIGTAHVSEESCKEARAAISLMKPEIVFLELCQKRTFILRRTHFSVPTISDMLATLRERRSNLLGVLYSWFMAKVASKLEALPGAEFRVAYEEAMACGAKVVLGDRDIEVTLRRTWGKMSTWYKTKFITCMVVNAFCLPKADHLNELIEKLQGDADMLTLAFNELGSAFPTVKETLIDERDMFMAAVLQKLGEDVSSIVAVVGRGHVAGMMKHWGQDIPIQGLLEVPQKKPFWNATLKFYALAALVASTSIILFAYYYQTGS